MLELLFSSTKRVFPNKSRPTYQEWHFLYNEKNDLKEYWNGWWISEKSAYAIGHVFQCIAITPKGIKLQLYHEDWDNEQRDYKNPIGKFKERLNFIDNIENEYK